MSNLATFFDAWANPYRTLGHLGRMRHWELALLMVALGGCLSADPPPRHSDSTTSTIAAEELAPPPTASVSDVPELTPSAVARIRDSGLSWSSCNSLSYSLYHRHDWSAELLPDEYRPLNTGGEVGELKFRGLDCNGMSIGNLTAIPGGQLVFFGISVEAPPEAEGPVGNMYVFEFVTDDETVHEQLLELGVPSFLGRMETGDATYSVESEGGPSVSAIETSTVDRSGNTTGQNRLHWKNGERLCWVDLERVVDLLADTTVAVEARAGSPFVSSGPAHRLAGPGSRLFESGHFSAPDCVEGVA